MMMKIPKKYSKPIGFTSLVLSTITYIAIFLVPFVNMNNKVMTAGILYVFSYIFFFIATYFLGKSFFQSIKEKCRNIWISLRG